MLIPFSPITPIYDMSLVPPPPFPLAPLLCNFQNLSPTFYLLTKVPTPSPIIPCLPRPLFFSDHLLLFLISPNYCASLLFLSLFHLQLFIVLHNVYNANKKWSRYINSSLLLSCVFQFSFLECLSEQSA